MQKKEKRIPLKRGTAIVDKNVKPETVKALNNLVECAHRQVSESLRLSGVSSRTEQLDEALLHATNFIADMHNSRIEAEGQPCLTGEGMKWLDGWQKLIGHKNKHRIIRALAYESYRTSV